MALPSCKGGLIHRRKLMKHLHAFTTARLLAWSGAVAFAILATPSLGADTLHPSPDRCTTAATAASAGTAGTEATGKSRGASTSRNCRGVGCSPSSTVTTGPGGLSGSTTLPDGSSVSVQSGGGTSASSTRSARRSTSASASADGGSSDCAAAASTGNDGAGNKLQKHQKENQDD